MGRGSADRLESQEPPIRLGTPYDGEGRRSQKPPVLGTRSISAHDVMTGSPDSLTVPVHPMASSPDVIRTARPISRTAVVRPIPDGHDHRTSAVIRTRAII